jgi:uncharacterized protein DUF1360
MAERVAFLVALAVVGARLTRLLVVDEFPPVKGLRHWFVRIFAAVDRLGNVVPDRERWGRLAGAAHSVAYVWTCPWCMSVWAAAAIWGIADWSFWGIKADMSVPWPWAMIALTSLLAGWDANLQGEHDKRWERLDRELRGERFER